jgi:predicted DNA-binding transcriptional regulator AlpA
MLTTREAAALLGLKPQTLMVWRCQGTGPPYFKLGKWAVRYDPDAVRQWCEANRRTWTGQRAPRILSEHNR